MVAMKENLKIDSETPMEFGKQVLALSYSDKIEFHRMLTKSKQYPEGIDEPVEKK